VTGEAVVFDNAPDPSDDSPTIISKKNGAAALSESAVGSIRGRRLTHYELIEPIGVGGMAAVIRARDTQLDRFVALKILPPDMAKDPENILRFHQEARAAAKLDHENIARVFYYGEDQGLHFIAFEFVEGQNLRTILERRGRIPVREAIRYVLQIAAGLEHASARGVVHRDVKPSNIIITPDGRAKLVDMGLARSMEKHSEQQLTQSGVTLGTFDYISPEQALEPRDADARSDIYSLGCTLYHMLTGHPPVPEGTAAKKLHHHQHVLPLDPRQHNSDVPDEVALVLGKMMAKDPKDRYQRPVELVQHLMKVAHKVGAADDLPEGVLFVDAHLPGEPRRRPLLILSLAALALAAILVVLSMAPSRSPNKTGKKSPDPHVVLPTSPKKIDDAPAVSVPAPPAMQPGMEMQASHVFADASLPAELDLDKKEFVVEDPGIVYQGNTRETIKNGSFRFDRKELKAERPHAVAGLTIEDGVITFRDVAFDMDNYRKTPKFPAAGIHIKGASIVKFERCMFGQTFFSKKPVRDDRNAHLVASVSVEGDAGKVPIVLFDRCFFDEGQVAVALYGPADVTATQCCFKPHLSLFQHRKTGESRIKLEHCSAFVMYGPAFRFDDEVGCTLTVQSCVFSCPVRKAGLDEPDFIYQTTSSASERIVYHGKRNRYHNLNNLLSSRRPDQRNIASYDLFVKTIEKADGKDEESEVMAPETSPWKVAQDPYREDKEKAFQLKLDLPEDVGAQFCAWGEVTPGIKIVDVAELNPDNKSTFETLEVALHASKPGDTILIKAGRGLKYGPEREVRADVFKSKLNVTLRAYPGEYPVLVMARPSRRASQFSLGEDTQIRFEKLEFVLEQEHQDGMPAGLAQSIVQLEGNAQCVFSECQITLRGKEGNGAPALTVVSVGAASQTRTPGKVTFKDTVIRGDGDIIRQKQHRAVDVEFDNALVALNGSVLQFQSGTRDTGKEPQTRITSNQSSFFLRKPFFHLNTLAGAASHPLWLFSGDKNRFISLDAATWPLVQLDAGEITRENAATFLAWTGNKNRYYLHTDRMLATRTEPAMGFELTGKAWAELFEMDKEPSFHGADITDYRSLADWTRDDDFSPHLLQLGDE
jgi:serine/threonine protein kinase